MIEFAVSDCYDSFRDYKNLLSILTLTHTLTLIFSPRKSPPSPQTHSVDEE